MKQTAISERAKEEISSIRVGKDYKIVLVSSDDVPYIWEKIHPHLELMEPHSEGELAPEAFYEAITNGDMQLWTAIKDNEIMASMVTQIIPYPKKRVLRIISIAGEEMDGWIKYLPLIEDWALSVGCTSLECWGRKGWLKILKDWKCSYHILTKDLTTRMH